MHFDECFESGSHNSWASEPGSAITFDDINTNDKVLIKTRNSEYRFEVADPLSHKGMLSGGSIGEMPREAFLIESLARADNGGVRNFKGLRTGAQALFYLSADQRIERVTTSRISGLTLIKAKDRPSLIS